MKFSFPLNERETEELEGALDQNSLQYTLEKTIEECNELACECIKRITKYGGPKEPTDEMIIDEIGDVMLRAGLLALKLDPEGKKLDARLNMKIRYLFERIAKYPGRL